MWTVDTGQTQKLQKKRNIDSQQFILSTEWSVSLGGESAAARDEDILLADILEVNKFWLFQKETFLTQRFLKQTHV